MRALITVAALLVMMLPAAAEVMDRSVRRPPPAAAEAEAQPGRRITINDLPVVPPPKEPAIHDAGKRGVFGYIRKLGCIAPDQIKAQYPPPDLYAAAAACIRDGNAERAYFLIRTAHAFGNFDTVRVANPASAVGVRQAMLAYLAEIPMEADHPLAVLFATQSKDGTPMHGRYCQLIRRISKPDYYPFYLVNYISQTQNVPKADPVREFSDFDIVRLLEDCPGTPIPPG